MKHETQVEILRQLIRNVDTKTTSCTEEIMQMPVDAYVSPEVAQREWKTFFQEHPQVLALSGELPKPGSYFTSDDLGVPILATRDQNGKFHAFVNACRHRGAQLASPGRGEQTRFVCPFHAWTYDLEGRLTNVRHGDLFGDIDKSCHGLIELPSAEKYGLLVVHPQSDGVVDIDALLGEELAEEIGGWNFEKSEFSAQSTIDRPLNWKLANDTFGEVYHFSVLHRNTLAKLLHGDYAVARKYGRNHLLCVPTRYLDVMRTRPESEWSLPFGVFMSYFLFPNTQLVFVSGMLTLVRIYPDPRNPGRSISRISHYTIPQIKEKASEAERATTVTVDSVYQADLSARLELDVTASLELFERAVEEEDYLMGQQAQITANSGRLSHFLFGRNEPTLHHFHNQYRELLGESPLSTSRG